MIKRTLTAILMASILTVISITPAFAWSMEEAVSDGDKGTTNITAADIEKYASGDGVAKEGESMWTTSDTKSLLKKIKEKDTGSNENGETQITVGDKTYYLDDNGLQACKTVMASAASKYIVKSKVDGMGTTFNVSADTDTAGVALSGIESLVGVIVGILCYVITLGMTLFTALDLCYITMPVFRNKCEDMKQSGNGVMTKTDKQSGETKLRWITDEAVYSVNTCSVETGKSALTVYLKKRVLAFVLLAVVLFILFTGNIQLIVNIAINLVAGIMDALSSLGA